jgi:hypothetical protein
MAVFIFDYTAWGNRYPSLAASVNASLASAYFAEACMYLDNTDSSIVTDAGQRGIIFNAIVAHLAMLEGAGRDGLVGRISSASQGSVSISAEYVEPGSGKWYAQTSNGVSAWQMLKRYRMARYIAPCTRPNVAIDQLWRGISR